MDDNYRTEKANRNNYICKNIIIVSIIFILATFLYLIFSNNKWYEVNIEKKEVYGIGTSYEYILTNYEVIDDFIYNGTTVLTSSFGNRLNYFNYNVQHFLINTFMEFRNWLNADGTVNKNLSQIVFGVSNNSTESKRSICIDPWGRMSNNIDNNYKCIANYDIDFIGNVSITENFIMNNYTSLSVNQTYEINTNGTNLSGKALVLGSYEYDFVVIRSSQKIVIEGTQQTIIIQDIVDKMNNLTSLVENLYKKLNMTF